MSTTLARTEKYRWTSQDYEKAASTGVFDNKRVELVEGEITTMSPIGSRHNTAVMLTDYALVTIYTSGYHVRPQCSFVVPPNTELQPDIAVVPGSIRDYADVNPEAAGLIVEVSDSSFLYDSTIKVALYARASVPEYWIINLNASSVLVYRNPVADANALLGHTYTHITTYVAGQTITPLTAGGATVAVTDLLP